jgi:hypothetical protein
VIRLLITSFSASASLVPLSFWVNKWIPACNQELHRTAHSVLATRAKSYSLTILVSSSLDSSFSAVRVAGRQLSIWNKSLPVHVDPAIRSKLKDRPDIYTTKDSITNSSPDSIYLIDNKIEEFPIIIDIKEIRGKVEWK